MVSQLCRVIDQGNGRDAWNVRAAVGGDIGYIADKPMVVRPCGNVLRNVTYSILQGFRSCNLDQTWSKRRYLACDHAGHVANGRCCLNTESKRDEGNLRTPSDSLRVPS